MALTAAGLDAADAQSVLDAVRKVTNVDGLDAFRVATLAAIRGLVECDGAGYNEVEPTVPSIVYLTDPIDYASGDVTERFERLAHEHPLLRHQRETGDGSPHRISEFLTQDEFHALALYRDLYRKIGVEYQVALMLPAPQPLIVAIVATSATRDFSDRDCAVLDAVRPHLAQAYRRADLHERMRGDLEAVAQVLVGPGRGVSLAQPDGRLRYLDEESAATVERYVADRDEITGWIEEQRVRLRTAPTVPSPFDPFVAELDGRRLIIRFIPGRGGTDVLVLHEHAMGRDAVSLEALGLTPREAEVLVLVTKGDSNAVIARALGAQPGTVRKHLENIYRKLGVRNRTEAAAAAFETFAIVDRP